VRLFFWIGMILLSITARAQETSSSIEGIVTDNEGEIIIGANVELIHLPTNTTYLQVSSLNGRYALFNLKTGGPYKLNVSFIGFTPYQNNSITLNLGQQFIQDVELKDSLIELDGIEVVHDKNELFSGNQNPGSANISVKRIGRTSTLNRSLQDIIRLSSLANGASFGGNNFRFNNLSIDGVSSNDVLGFNEPASGAVGSVASGTPGALAGTQPISIDAVENVQVALAPFDVKFGNFTGASLNAVTKSGKNRLEGSVYAFGRNQLLTGKSLDEQRRRIASYYDFQSGISIGGPIKKDKIFFFFNYEKANRNEPVLSQPGNDDSRIAFEVAKQIADTLVSRYGYDPGTYQAANNERKSDKVFIRLDFNLGKKHQLTIRDNYVTASADRLERSANFLSYGNHGFTHSSITNGLVGELKSSISNSISNHLVVGHQIVKDNRTFDGGVFPHLEIKHNTANTIFAGTYREASLYGLTLNTYQLSDNLTIQKNNHIFTLGTSNDFYKVKYNFLTAWNGRWEYKSVDAFFDDAPSRIRGVYSFSNNDYEYNLNRPSADYDVIWSSLYFQDRYWASNRLNITAGVRLDAQLIPNKPQVSKQVLATDELKGFHNNFSKTIQFNPRLSFNYTMGKKKDMQLRGGSGIFTGRVPLVWYAYAYYIAGIDYGNIDLKPDGAEVPITENLAELRTLQSDLTEINLIDDDFKLPRIWRSSLAYDVKLPGEFVISVEGVLTKSIKDILFKSLNLKDSTTSFSGADQRPYYLGSGDDKKVNPAFTNVFVLTNTNKGYKYSLSLNAQKKFGKDINIKAAYTHGQSKDVTNGVRNSMAANFNWNQAIDANNPALSFSNFDIRHRINGMVDYLKSWNKRHETFLGLIFSSVSGSPFSFIYEGDVNNDGSSKNDLIYVPASQSEVNLKPIDNGSGEVISADQQWEQLDSYISRYSYLENNRGNYVERNGARTPWNHRLDLRLNHKISFKGKSSMEVSLDVFNVLNLLNYRWGKQYFVPNVQNSSVQLLDFEGIEDSQPVYQFKNPQGTPWLVDQLNSRWQAQLGVRYRF